MKLKDYKPILIVGLQKSGTSLAFRLLKEQDVFKIPFNQEGRYFWGDYPPFSPTMFPTGHYYQKYDGVKGHELNSDDIDSKSINLLLDRLKSNNVNEANWLNKNPYNTMRIKWLRALFPNCYIIAIYRKPESNIFSLLKKHTPHAGRGLGPENEWWGVKPNNWKSIVHDNIINQLSYQWKYTNSYLLEAIDDIDLLIDYEDLCNHPNKFINIVLNNFSIQPKVSIDSLTCTNKEYKTGSGLLSKNRAYRNRVEGLYLSEHQNNTVELPPLSISEKFKIKRLCFGTWVKCNKHKTKLNIL